MNLPVGDANRIVIKDLKKPLDAIPVMIAKIKKMYPENKLILFIVL